MNPVFMVPRPSSAYPAKQCEMCSDETTAELKFIDLWFEVTYWEYAGWQFIWIF